MPNLLDRIEGRIEKLAMPFAILLLILAALNWGDIHLIYGGFCFVHGTILLLVPVCLLLALWSFFMYFVSLARMFKAGREEQAVAAGKISGLGISPRGMIVNALEEARQKDEQRQRIKDLYP